MKLGKMSNQGPESQTILEAAKKFAAEVIATPCPLCRQNVEMYQDAVTRSTAAITRFQSSSTAS